MRAIDADALHAEISKWPESIMYKDWVQSAIATAPTLTQPNEPLTLEELDGWNTKPAYLVPLGEQPWAAQWSIMRYGRFVVETNAGPTMSICLSKSEYGKTWLAYRRPPEGESPHDWDYPGPAALPRPVRCGHALPVAARQQGCRSADGGAGEAERGGPVMDIEELIDGLKKTCWGASAREVDDERRRAAAALSTLQAENERLRGHINDLETQHRTEMCENGYDCVALGKLRAKLQRAVTERDVLISRCRGECWACVRRYDCGNRRGPHSGCWTFDPKTLEATP